MISFKQKINFFHFFKVLPVKFLKLIHDLVNLKTFKQVVCPMAEKHLQKVIELVCYMDQNHLKKVIDVASCMSQVHLEKIIGLACYMEQKLPNLLK